MEITKLEYTTEKKNPLDGLHTRMEITEVRNNKLEDRSIDSTQSKQWIENRLKKKMTEPQSSVGQ